MRRTFLCLLFMTATAASAAAQEQAEERRERDQVTFSAGFESNSLYYWNDKTSGAMAPDDRFASNNYLKADLFYGKFSAGVQAEGYMPVLQGYPAELKDMSLPFKYVSFSDRRFNVTVGDFYAQYGNGLLMRAWEDRALGINTSIEGVTAGYSYNDIVRVSVLYGRSRLYLSHADSWMRGVDASFSLSSLCNWQKVNLAIEGSYLGKYETLLNPDADRDLGMNSTINGYSARLNLDAGGFVFKGEFVDRDPDTSIANDLCETRSRAYLVEAGYYGSGIGVQLSLRKLENMAMQCEREQSTLYSQINYLPALTQQYTYSLASLNPYQTQAMDETGGQFDVFYNIKRGSSLGGKYGTKLHFNTSAYYGPEDPYMTAGPTQGDNELYFCDVAFDIEKQWNKAFKMKLLYTMQQYNPIVQGYVGEDLWVSHTVVADMTYKFNKRHSLRAELQHLSTREDQKNWVAAMLEYSIAPKWSFFVSDMWNYGSTDIHYYNGGVSFAHSKTRLGFNVGRFRQGYLCAGGVCRVIPAYTGANLTMTMAF